MTDKDRKTLVKIILVIIIGVILVLLVPVLFSNFK
jgi:hypothetical protein